MTRSVQQILALWPNRRAVFEDAQTAETSLQFVAVHRWFERGSVPAKYHSALMSGARRRGLDLTYEDIATAHDPGLAGQGAQ